MARWTFIALAVLVGEGCQALAQTPNSTDAGPPNVLQNTMGLYGVQMPSPDAGVTPASCHPYGATCATPKECCSQQCTNGMCGDGAVSCRPPGTPCRVGPECCSTFCEMNVCR
jgi:hypothetical protein